MIVSKAKEYAINLHKEKNCTYGDLPYETHLQLVVDNVERFIHLLPEYVQDDVRCAGWGHDLIEDCGVSYNDVKKALGEAPADIIYDVSNEMGKNRREKAEKTYPKIRKDYRAVYLKGCDRLANAEYSKANNPRMFAMYKKEYPTFRKALMTDPNECNLFVPLWDALDKVHEYKDTTVLQRMSVAEFLQPFREKIDGKNHHFRDELLKRNGIWGTCVDCPKDETGFPHPERCKNVDRGDHKLIDPVIDYLNKA